MATRTDAYPDVAIPPGEYLAEEIEARNFTQKELSKRMGRPVNAINEIINGKKAITADTALQLESVMPEIPARFWLNLETDYQLTKALVKRGSVRNRPYPRSLGVEASGRTKSARRTTEERAEPRP